METYDVVVIGAGPAGYFAAIRASQLGQKTAIVDKEFLGGVCLNIGCIPSKSLLYNAEVAHTLRHRGKELGFSFENLELDYPQAVKRSRQVSDRLVRGVGFLMRKNKIDVHMGRATMTTANSLTVTSDAGEVTELQAKHVIVATGGSPMVIPGVEIDGDRILTYREAILQENQPSSVVIIGGSAIGVEFATIWNSYGVDVTIVEMLPRLVPLEDEEVSAELMKSFKKDGMTIKTGHTVESVQSVAGGVQVQITSDEGDETLEADQALLAIGFRPNTSNLGLEELGVELDPRGAIVVDDRMASNIPGIWAIGDVTAKLMLAHVGQAQGIVCAENIAGVETVVLDYEMMPKATYCHPQIASFGMTESQANERGYQVKIGRFPFQANGKALGLGDYTGWIKLVTDERYGEILGAHIVGPGVTELLPELTLSQMMELTSAEIARNVHAHPTLSEVLTEAAHDAEGHAINM
jgi:dihydrolipoamide dehydrogenase